MTARAHYATMSLTTIATVSIMARRLAARLALPLGCAIALSAAPGLAADVPDDTATPGAVDPSVTQDNIHETICRRGWEQSVLPPESYTERIKQHLLAFPLSPYYDRSSPVWRYRLDRRLPIRLGGSPDDPGNMWPQRRDGVWNADRKDELEEVILDLVCRHVLTLREGQEVFWGDWRDGWRRYIGLERPPLPRNPL
jgi:hypothetical protein